jgi:DNA-binding transcriptional MerR regulator
MAVAALDTLSLTKRLRAAGFTEDQAEAVTDVVREASQADLSVLATKEDVRSEITSAKAELKADISDTKAEILKWMFGMVGVQTLVILGALATLLRVGLRP